MKIQNEQLVHESVKAGELEIDEQGRVWRIARRRYGRWVNGVVTEKCARRRAESPANRYLQVRSMHNGKRINASAHRLVWFHFNGAIPDGLTINHKNGKKHDNRPENLELATQVEQMAHARFVLKVMDRAGGEKCPASKLKESQAIEIKRMAKSGTAISAIAKQFNVCRQTVWNVVNGTNWRHLK